MKKFYYGLNVFLVLAIPLMIFSNFSNKKVDIQKKTQSLNTSVFTEGKKLVEESKVLVDDITDSEKHLFDESLSIMETSVSNSLVTGNIITDVLETQVGTMSSYGPDCVGCSGRLGGGYDARSGNYTYNDKTYGTVRIVAGDASYPYGSIVRVKGSKLGEFYAIVLDRGGAIGKGKRFMFDLLFPNESLALGHGTEKGLVFEIVRYGY